MTMTKLKKWRPRITQPKDESIRSFALTQNQVAIVDADRYDWAMKWNWYAKWNPNTRSYYAARYGRKGGPRHIYLHRQIMGEPEGIVDHANGNTLDCRVSNLRACTVAQNGANRRPHINNTSGYTGIGWHEAKHKWEARIWVNYRSIHLGYFDYQTDAINARWMAEHRYFGEFAYSARGEVA